MTNVLTSSSEFIVTSGSTTTYELENLVNGDQPEQEPSERIVDAMARMPRYDVIANPSKEAWIFWHLFLQRFGLQDLEIGDVSFWAEETRDDEHAFRFTLTENWPAD